MKKLIIIYILFASFLHAEESLEERKKNYAKIFREQVIVFNVI